MNNLFIEVKSKPINDNNVARLLYIWSYDESSAKLRDCTQKIKKMKEQGHYIFTQCIYQALTFKDEKCLKVLKKILTGIPKYDQDELRTHIQYAQESGREKSVRYLKRFLIA